MMVVEAEKLRWSHLYGGVSGFFLSCLFCWLRSFRGGFGGGYIFYRLVGRGAVHPLNDGHWGGIAHAGAELGDAAVATLAGLGGGRGFCE